MLFIKALGLIFEHVRDLNCQRDKGTKSLKIMKNKTCCLPTFLIF